VKHDQSGHCGRPRHRAVGLKQFFSEQVDLRVVGEAASGREAIDLVRTTEMDVLVMDLSMPGQSGIDALGMIRAKAPTSAS